MAAASLSLVISLAWGPANTQAGEYTKGVVVTTLNTASTTTNGQAIEYPKTDAPEVRFLMIEIPPGAETGWHKHPMQCYAYMISGTITVETEDGKRSTFHQGQAFAEMVNALHNGKNTGTEPVWIMMTVTGAKGVPTTEVVRASAKKDFRKKNASVAGRGQGMSEAAVVSYSPSEMTPLHGLCRRSLFGKDFWQML